MLYLALGMRLKKSYRALRFEQSPGWSHTSAGIPRCKEQTSCDFEKVLYRLMNNSVLGKTMENLRK